MLVLVQDKLENLKNLGFTWGHRIDDSQLIFVIYDFPRGKKIG